MRHAEGVKRRDDGGREKGEHKESDEGAGNLAYTRVMWGDLLLEDLEEGDEEKGAGGEGLDDSTSDVDPRTTGA